ncbi:MAG: hypothetical protein QNK30_06165 [Bacteroidales bacterium]|nr:hypothetical protein [Bacteroidales bacterium]
MIQYFKNSEINKEKWDICIQQSTHPLVYAMSWYLDIVSPGWDAFVEGEYAIVFPLTRGSKFGIPYLYQPMFTQQLGFFSDKTLAPKKIDQFLQSIPARFLLVDINIWNEIEFSPPGVKTYRRNNFQMSLAKTYEEIQDKYATNTQRNIDRAQVLGLTIKEAETNSSILQLKKENIKIGLKESDFQILDSLLNYALKNGYGKIYEVYINSDLLASAFFISFNKRLTYLLSASSQKGKDSRAMFFLIDEIIRKHSGTDIILDFEGSEIPGLARFFSGFGSSPVNYKRLTFNNLPYLLKPLYRLFRPKSG